METDRPVAPTGWRAPLEEFPELLLDKTMTLSRLGQLGLLAGLALLCALILAIPMSTDWRLWISAGLLTLTAGGWLLLHFRGPMAAAGLLVAGGWLLVTAVGASGLGLVGAHFAAYPLLLFLSGWLLGGVVCVGLFVLSCVAVGSLAVVQAAGWPGLLPVVPDTIVREATTLLVIMSVTTIATLYLVQAFAERYAELRQINEQNQVDLQVAQAREADFRLLAEHIPGLVFQCDVQGRCVYVNQRLANFLGRPKTTLLGTPMVELLAGGSVRDVALYQKAVLRGKVVAFEMRRLASDGIWCDVEVTLVPRQAADAERVAGWYGMIYDVTQRERIAVELRDKAMHDPLTGLPNRTLFYERLQHAMRSTFRNRKLVAVMYVDLDNFKRINDVMGHPTGDAFLQEVARRLTAATRASDTVARLGGDEFVVLAENVDAPEAAEMLAGKVLDALMQPMVLGKESVSAGASIGIALGPQDGDNGDALLRAADAALYEAKAAGRKCYRLFGEGNVGAPETGAFSRPASL